MGKIVAANHGIVAGAGAADKKDFPCCTLVADSAADPSFAAAARTRYSVASDHILGVVAGAVEVVVAYQVGIHHSGGRTADSVEAVAADTVGEVHS